MNDLAGSGHEHAHDLRIKQVAVGNGILCHQALLISIVTHASQNLFQFRRIHCDTPVSLFQFIQSKQFQQPVGREDNVLRGNQSCTHAIRHQLPYIRLYRHFFSLLILLPLLQ